ncbi:SEC-C metal-binding domain-containing protein [Halomonas sp. PBN3]|uniref:SEC-C metal-binding domain-containing protein n=1 Tax=Halomonas sp. PBN3 TaxID=1397528 RepID=UPI0003B8E19B|nr:SEC-C metal-binding domain-containing protein [Halomonas sp. PBN3]ERS85700.1 hypothetical protein Q671_09515 [Halomonas sp. PBN3]
MTHDDIASEMPPELWEGFLRFFDASIAHILAHQDAERYFADLGDIVRQSGLDTWLEGSMPYWMLGRSIWNQMPLPCRHFQCAPLPAPQRNDSCPCGSGKKFKRCCQPLVNSPMIDLDDVLPIPRLAVDHFTKAQRQAAAKTAPAEVRLALAVKELEDDHPGKARNLLLAILDKGGLSTELQADTVQLLGNAYSALGHLDAGERKLTALLPNLKPQAANQALCWLVIHCLDQGRNQEALEHVHRLERLAPEQLSTGALKTLCLRQLGDDAEAQRTAQAWLPVAHELGDEEGIAMLEEQASLGSLDDLADGDIGDDEWSLSQAPMGDEAYAIFGIPEEQLQPLVGLLEEALEQPLHPAHFDPGPPSTEGRQEQWVLVLPEEVDKAQAAFYQAGEMQSVADAELIRRHPALLQSPDFLERLGAFTGASSSQLQEAFNMALFAQQERVIAHLLAALPAGGQLPWAWLEHRPLLRLMREMALGQEDPDEEIELLTRVLTLCPDDNLGVRGPLVNALLQAGHDEPALAICERYPDDFLPETRYGRVLALIRLNRLHEAKEALATAYQALPKVLNYLVASKRKAPRLDPHGITIGGTDQAWYYREEMRDTFLTTPGALSWMEHIKKAK